jgi:hypothetical protein
MATDVMIAELPGPTTAHAPNNGRVETLERLAALRDRGAIANDEYPP